MLHSNNKDFGKIPCYSVNAVLGDKLMRNGMSSSLKDLTKLGDTTVSRARTVSVKIDTPGEGVYSVMLNRTFSLTQKKVNILNKGWLWRLRGVHDLKNTRSTLIQNILPDSNNDREYARKVTMTEQDLIVKSLLKMNLNDEEKTVDVNECNMDVPLDTEILKYVELLRQKLDDSAVRNLFDNPKYSPTENLLCRMLENKKMNSPLDFELAINEEFNTDNTKKKLSWTHKIIDNVAGSGTVSKTLIKLKEMGVYRGMKRLNEEGIDQKPSKLARIGDIESLFNNLSIKGVEEERIQDMKSGVIGKEVKNKLGRSHTKNMNSVQPKIVDHVTVSQKEESLNVTLNTPRGKMSSRGRRKLKFGSAKKTSPKSKPITASCNIRPYLKPLGDALADPTDQGNEAGPSAAASLHK